MKGLTDLLKGIASRNIEAEPYTHASSDDLDDVAMTDDPSAQYILALRKKRKALMLKKLLQQSGDSDMMRNITIRERT